MKIEVCPTRGSKFMIIVDHTATVKQLKEAIALTVGTNPNNISCVHHGEIMIDENPIKVYHLHNKSKVYISIKSSSTKKQKIFIPAPTNEQINQSFGGMSVADYLEHLKLKNPKISHLINDEDTVLEIMSTISDPAVNFEKLKMTDRMLDKDEMVAGRLMDFYHNALMVEELYESMLEPANTKETVIPDKASEPSTEALPTINPYEKKLLILEELISRNPINSNSRKLAEALLDLCRKCYKEKENMVEKVFDKETDDSFFFGEAPKSKPFRQVFHTPSGDQTYETTSYRRIQKPKATDESDDPDLGVD